MFTKLFFTPVYDPDSTRLLRWCVSHLNLFTGEYKEMNFHLSEISKQDVAYYQKGALIQQAFAGLTRTQREFLLSGLTPYEQEKLGMSLD